MRRTHLLPVLTILTITGCRGSEPNESGSPDGPTTTVPVDTDTIAPTTVDTAGTRAPCFEEPLQAIPGGWEVPWQPGQGQFVPYEAGATLGVYHLTGFKYIVDLLVANAHSRVLLEIGLLDTGTLDPISRPSNLVYPLEFPDGSCQSAPTSLDGLLWFDAINGDPVNGCIYHDTPVTLAWTVRDLVDERAVSGSLDLVVHFEPWQLAECGLTE